MPPANSADADLPAIVCLDPAGAIWSRLKGLLESNSGPSKFILARASESSADILTLCRRLMPALLVLEDAQLHHVPFTGLHGLLGPAGIQVLVFSEKTDDPSVEYFFRQGCAGVLSAGKPDDVVLKAIQALFSGELWLPRKLISKLAREMFFKGPTPKLTHRESDILRLISLGHTNQEIADHCFISRETVRWHIRSLYNKIGVADRDGAIRQAKFFREVGPGLPPSDDATP